MRRLKKWKIKARLANGKLLEDTCLAYTLKGAIKDWNIALNMTQGTHISYVEESSRVAV